MASLAKHERKDSALRRFFQRPARTPSPTVLSSTVASQANAHSAPSNEKDVNISSHNSLESVFERLDSQDRVVVQDYLPSQTADVHTVLDEVWKAAKDKQLVCEQQQWTWTIRGKIVKLRDPADKVVRWLERFKDFGDVAVSADPLHAGIPWAGIRLLLQVTLSERQEMAALVSGLDVALYMMNRLRLYREYLQSLPKTTNSARQLEGALAEFHALILQFLAHALRLLSRDALSRTLRSLWTESRLTVFGQNCDTIAIRTSEQAQICERQLAREGSIDAARRHKHLLNALEELKDQNRDLRQVLITLQEKIDQGNFPVAQGAAFDSYEQQHNPECLQDTRVDLLRQIDEWSTQPTSRSMFWLRGMAGTGKSTISRTVARTVYQRGQLGASFFFQRGAKGGDRANGKKFFTTLCAQLAEKIPGMQIGVSEALNSEHDVTGKNLDLQFKQLIMRPLEKSDIGAEQHTRWIVVVDALDECDSEHDTRAILRLLRELNKISQLRIFLTSRPELSILSSFHSMSSKLYEDIVLHDIEESIVEKDIGVYLRHEFERIRQERLERQPLHPLDTSWPGQYNIDKLTKKAAPLFIFAATICKFVGDSRADPESRLQAVLENPQGISSSKLDQTYQPILNVILAEDDVEDKAELIREFKELVGPIVVLYEPLSSNDLANILGKNKARVRFVLDQLQSVLNVPDDPDLPIKTLHLSFRDFLVDKEKKGVNELWIDEFEVHRQLFNKCLDFLSGPIGLRSNICNFTDASVSRTAADEQQIKSTISMGMSYACEYWDDHLYKCGATDADWRKIQAFLQDHLLHCAEVFAWIDKLSTFLNQMNAIYWQQSTRPGSDELQYMLHDGSSFLSQNTSLILEAPLQVYAAAKYIYAGEIPDFKIDIPSCLPEIQWVDLAPSRCKIQSLTLLLDQDLLAIEDEAGEMRFWSITKGKRQRTVNVEQHYLSRVRFSPSGKLFVACSREFSITLWSTSTGRSVKTLQGHKNSPVQDFAISRDDQWLVSASNSSSEIKLWSLATGSEQWTSRCCHSCDWRTVAITNRGHIIASQCSEGSVSLWGAASGDLLRTFKKDNSLSAMALSDEADLLVCCTASVALWDLREPIRELSSLALGARPPVCHTVFFEDGEDKICTNIGSLDIVSHTVTCSL